MKANVHGFRNKTEFKKVVANFVFQGGGLGDYINMVAALVYVAEKMPFVHGRIIATEPFLSVAKHLFRWHRHWRCIDLRAKEIPLDDGSLIINPEAQKQSINATNAHLLDLGFIYYVNVDRAPLPEYNVLPLIDYIGPWKWPGLDHSKPYAVFTPGATTEARTMPAKAFNELVSYTISNGVTPVFLGKADFASGTDQDKFKAYKAKFSDEYDLSKGLDLREKTTLLESTQIMANATFVLGLDNGLLHFACTTDTFVIFGHNVASIEHRKPRRKIGTTINMGLSKKDLPCIGCQSDMRFLPGHRFTTCAYKDFLCLDFLFADNCAAWKGAIDLALRGHGE